MAKHTVDRAACLAHYEPENPNDPPRWPSCGNCVRRKDDTCNARVPATMEHTKPPWAVNAHDDLVAACEPFAKAASHMKSFGGDATQNGVWTSPDGEVRLTVAHFRALEAALTKAGKDEA